MKFLSLEDPKKKRKNYQLYELAKTRGIEVKGNGSGTNRRDVEVDCHYLEVDGGTSRRLEVDAGEKVLLVEVAQLFVGVAAGKRNVKDWNLRVEDERSGEIYL